MEWLWLNGFWLLMPVLIWNLIYASRLPQKVFNCDDGMPAWLLGLENLLRIPVFFFPLLLEMKFQSDLWPAGVLVYLAGSLAYYGSWIPLVYFPGRSWSRSFAGVISPHILPILVFGGAALICVSWLYLLFSVLMISVHAYHGWLGWKAYGSQLVTESGD